MFQLLLLRFCVYRIDETPQKKEKGRTKKKNKLDANPFAHSLR